MVTFLDPEKIIDQLKLEPDWRAAEFGCGTGGFAVALAKKLFKGIVYALDIQEEPLSALAGRAKAEGLSNMRTIQCDLEDPQGSTLQNEFLDLVLIANLLFQVEEKEAVLKEAKRVLKPKGKIVVVDWRPNSPFGPEGERISFEEVEKMMRVKLEMRLVKEIDAGTYHWGAVFEKNRSQTEI